MPSWFPKPSYNSKIRKWRHNSSQIVRYRSKRLPRQKLTFWALPAHNASRGYRKIRNRPQSYMSFDNRAGRKFKRRWSKIQPALYLQATMRKVGLQLLLLLYTQRQVGSLWHLFRGRLQIARKRAEAEFPLSDWWSKERINRALFRIQERRVV